MMLSDFKTVKVKCCPNPGGNVKLIHTHSVIFIFIISEYSFLSHHLPHENSQSVVFSYFLCIALITNCQLVVTQVIIHNFYHTGEFIVPKPNQASFFFHHCTYKSVVMFVFSRSSLVLLLCFYSISTGVAMRGLGQTTFTDNKIWGLDGFNA